MKHKRRKFPIHFHLQPYKGSEYSGVAAFEIEDNYIIVEFKDDGGIYLYNDQRPGKELIEIMKTKAIQGNKLASHISQEVKKNYAAIWNDELKIFEENKE